MHASRKWILVLGHRSISWPLLLTYSILLVQGQNRAARDLVLKADSNLVLVPVTVRDRMGRVVANLQEDQLRVFDENEVQDIAFFSSETVPYSVGLVVDLSHSMKKKMSSALSALGEFFKSANTEDEAFLVSFAARPELRIGFTQNLAEIQNSLILEQPGGRTALIDAILLSLRQMQSARNPRKALIVISDAGENNSIYSKSELLRVAMEADVQIFSVVVQNGPRGKVHFRKKLRLPTVQQQSGESFLKKLAKLAGGLHFVVRYQLGDVMTQIGAALREQYVIGYYPQRSVSEHKWRRIRVKLDARGRGPLRAYTPSGYYTPEGR